MANELKDPQAIDNYGFDWADWLGDDVLLTSAWAVVGPDSALVVGTDTKSGTITQASLSGGTPLRIYAVTNTVTSDSGRKGEKTLDIQVLDD